MKVRQCAGYYAFETSPYNLWLNIAENGMKFLKSYMKCIIRGKLTIENYFIFCVCVCEINKTTENGAFNILKLHVSGTKHLNPGQGM